MAAEGIVIRGTVLPDGTLQVPGPVRMPAGPVEVELRPVKAETKGEDFFQFLDRMRAEQAASGYVPRTAEEIDASIREMRDEWDEQSREIQELQEWCRLEREKKASSREGS